MFNVVVLILLGISHTVTRMMFVTKICNQIWRCITEGKEIFPLLCRTYCLGPPLPVVCGTLGKKGNGIEVEQKEFQKRYNW